MRLPLWGRLQRLNSKNKNNDNKKKLEIVWYFDNENRYK